MAPKILILDDDIETQRLLSSALATLGCSVALARRICEARRLVAQTPFDLLVIDGLLPDGNGADFIADLYDREYPAKVVFISSFFRSIDHYRRLTRELGVALVMAKPFSPQEFLFQIRSLLGDAASAADRVIAPTAVVEAPARDASPQPRAPSAPAPSRVPPEAAPDGADLDDELNAKLAALHAAYAASLDGKVHDLTQALSRVRDDGDQGGRMGRDALVEARKLAHKMHGTAGSYGFSAISDEAGLIEQQLVTWLDRAAGQQASDDLDDARRWEMIDRALATLRHEVERASASDGSERAADEFADGLAMTPMASAPDQALTGALAPAAGMTTVLFVDDDRDFLARIAALGEQSVTRVLTASNADEAVYRVQSHKVDAAVIDVLLGDDETPQEVAEKLRRQRGYQNLPLAFISGDGGLQNRITAVSAGVSLFLNKPLTREEFVEAVHQLSGAAEARRPRVLIVDDDPLCTSAIAELLEAHGYEPHTLDDATEIVNSIEELRPDLLLLDLMMPEISGFDICKIVRANPRWHIPLLVMTGQTSAEVRVAAYSAGADDFLVKPIIKEELLVRLRLRLEQAAQARDRSDRDPLTGLLSRRAFIRAFPSRLDEIKRRETTLSLCLIDLDHFKKVNDTYGHLAGDRVLANFGRTLSVRFRGSDLRCRWGGEEFVIVFVGEDATTAAEILDRVRQEFEEVRFTGDNGHHFTVSFSAGICSFPGDGDSLEELLRSADKRLYQAKDAGRAQTLTGNYPSVATANADDHETIDRRR